MITPVITGATYITLLRITLVVPIVYALLNNYFLLAGLLAAIAAFTDILDGYIARRYQQESALGALLDPVADKLFILSTFTALWYKFDLVPAWFIIFLWVKEICLFVGATIITWRGYTPFPARFSGKLAMMSQVAYCLLLFFTRYTELQIPTFLTATLIPVTLITLYALIDYAKVGYHTLYKP